MEREGSGCGSECSGEYQEVLVGAITFYIIKVIMSFSRAILGFDEWYRSYATILHGIPAIEGVMLLLNQAVENGAALVLEESPLDADTVHRKAVCFAQTAPAGPVFRHRPKRVAVNKPEKFLMTGEEEPAERCANEVRRKKDSGSGRAWCLTEA